VNAIYGKPSATELAIGHEVACDPRFDDEPVAFYDELVEKYGTDSAGRIWLAAGQYYDWMHMEDEDAQGA
jgi:hypothetical protein